MNAVGIILNVINNVPALKSNKNLTADEIKENAGILTNDCTDEIAVLRHNNTTIQQTRKDHFANSLDNKYCQFKRDVPFFSVAFWRQTC